MTSYAPGSYVPGYGIVGQGQTEFPNGGGGGGYGAFSEYMNAMLPSGISRGTNQQIARNLGYQGEFGQGGHSAWMGADPTRKSAFDRAIAEATDEDDGTNFGQNAWATQSSQEGGLPRWLQQRMAQSQGYGGGFGAGEHNAWLSADQGRNQQWNAGQQAVQSKFGAFGDGMGNGMFGGMRPGMFGGYRGRDMGGAPSDQRAGAGGIFGLLNQYRSPNGSLNMAQDGTQFGNQMQQMQAGYRMPPQGSFGAFQGSPWGFG